ncbi:MAG: hypothetical protein JWN04_173 [Myxococcaceae bacterium]|nr:hypothetical protein [Myxococcaceae bacterium]
MRWECTECGAELEGASRPRACPECGTAALFVRTGGAARAAELEPDDLRERWLRLGLQWAADGSFVSV